MVIQKRMSRTTRTTDIYIIYNIYIRHTYYTLGKSSEDAAVYPRDIAENRRPICTSTVQTLHSRGGTLSL